MEFIKSFFVKENIPNFLSLIRIMMVPVYLFLYFTEHYRMSGAVFLFTGITDVVDGFIARKNGWVSDVGKLLDPLADKMIQISAISCLTWVGGREVSLPSWIFFIMIVKELLQVAGAAFILGEKKIYVHSRWFGKVSTVIIYIVILTLTFVPHVVDQTIINTICGVAAGFMVFTFIGYLLDFKHSEEASSQSDQ